MHKVLFIDRDGTIISEPAVNFQVDSIKKLVFEPNVIISLSQLQQHGYKLVMVSNQDGLGTETFTKDAFDKVHNFMMQIINSQGVFFEEILICPHYLKDHCDCRKPKVGLVKHWLQNNLLDKSHSYVIGDRITDMELANNMNIFGLHYQKNLLNWEKITKKLTKKNRYAVIERSTKETEIKLKLWLDSTKESKIKTGISFFDHMLYQICIHGNFCMHLSVIGDLDVDDHHTVEDTALVLGKALLKALGNKNGIGRFGFLLPMDDALAYCALDLSGRPYLKYQAKFNYQYIGKLNTQMIEHFFRSLSSSMLSTLHLRVQGKNDHHRAESLFKSFGRTLRQAIHAEGQNIPSSKGILE